MPQRGARAALGRGRPRASARAASRSPARECRQQPLEAVAPAAEADDHSRACGTARSTSGHAASEQVDALGDDELADERHVAVAPVAGRASRGRGRPPRRRARRRGRPRRSWRAAQAPVASAAHPGRRLRARPRPELGDVDPGRSEAGAGRERVVVHRRPEALGGVPRPDEDRARAGEALAGEGEEAVGSRLTVYSSALPWTFTA